MKRTETMPERAEMAVAGLGVMGANLALNIEEQGFPVAVWNRNAEKTHAFLQQHGGKRFAGAESLEELIALLAPPRRILIMVKAGPPVDSMIEQLAPRLETGDILIDGGNSHFRETARRNRRLEEQGIGFVGLGVSGGESGARHGPSLMPGGPRPAYEKLQPILERIAAKSDSGPCVAWLGPGGAGHFVKTVHNAIEYGIMQLLAEAYDLLRRGAGLEVAAIADLFGRWNNEILSSFLTDLTAKVLRVTDPQSGKPLVEMILDEAGQKGTGRWAGQDALDLGVPVPTIMAALFARNISAMKNERLQAARIIAGPETTAFKGDTERLIAAVRAALVAATVCTYAEGMTLIAKASDEYDWQVELAETARIWKAGCIIRSGLLDPMMKAFAGQPDLANLLLDKNMRKLVESHQEGWRRAMGLAAELGIPLPATGAALAYFDSYRSAVLPQKLTQAQRDAFGAHTYRRLDDPDGESIHTEWTTGGN